LSTLQSVIAEGTAASRPAAGIAGRLYFAVDTTTLYYDNGSTWDTWATGGGGSPNFADAETPSGTIDGVNTTFTLAHAPSPAASLILVMNGITLREGGGNDYTLSTSTITMASAPETGTILICWYRY
jgi:hypothetical protein